MLGHDMKFRAREEVLLMGVAGKAFYLRLIFLPILILNRGTLFLLLPHHEFKKHLASTASCWGSGV